MTDHEQKPAAKRRKPSTEVPTGKKSLKIIPGTIAADPKEPKPSTVRVVTEPEEPLDADERRERFATNLDRLIGIVGLSRKDAARETGIPYKLMRRLVSAGVAVVGARNQEALKSIASYFALPSANHLWRNDLFRRMLTTDEGSGFVEKFRQRLLAEHERRVAGARVIGHEELLLLGRALGVEGADLSPLTGPYADKVTAILASAKADTFKRIIDDYHEIVLRHASALDVMTTEKPARP